MGSFNQVSTMKLTVASLKKKKHLLTPQLHLNPFQRPLQTQSKINLLGCSPKHHVLIELCHGLYGLDSRVDVRVQGVEEGVVVDEMRDMFDCALDEVVDFDVLLEVK
jgi:hypothetical protein